jgi:hypothetical protein
VKKVRPTVIKHQDVSGEIDNNLKKVVDSTGNPADLVIHRIEKGTRVFAAIVYLESLVDGSLLGSHMVEPINNFVRGDGGSFDLNNARLVLSSSKVIEFSDLHDAIDSLLAGQALVFVSKGSKVLAVSYPGFPRRQMEEPATEKVVRGSREGFTEVLKDNQASIRRWIKDPNLRLESKIIGERTKTEVSVLYLNDVANPEIVKEVHKRLEQIKIDGIIDSAYISELITDCRLTVFPLVQETERPDKVAAAILEGRVAILVDKSPFALIVPVTSNEFYQTSEDFYFNYWIGSFLRIIRALGTITAVVLPGLYVTVMSVNPELLPTVLEQVLASARIPAPFSVIFEILLALLVFEIFREAIIRVPANLNLVLGIAGGIMLWQAAIQTGIVSGPAVIVVFITALSSFSTANPAKEQAWRLVRYFLLFAGGAFGILGLTLAGMVVLTHLASLKSFGVSYLAPWSPPLIIDMIDGYFRIPWWASYRRPPTYRPVQEDRLGTTEGEDEA